MGAAQQSDTDDLRKTVSKYAEGFVNLALRCDVPETAERIERAKSDYDTQTFNLVVTSGKPKVGKSRLICSILNEPNLLSEDTKTPYKILLPLKLNENELVEDLSNLMEWGYYELTVPVGTEQSTISGKIVSETPETITLQIEKKELVLPKSPPSTIVTFDDEEIVGWIESGNPPDDKIVLKKVDGTEEEIDTFDIKGPPTVTNFVGKRRQKYTVLFKADKQKPEKQIDPGAVDTYVTRDDVASIVLRLHNTFLERHPGIVIVDTPYLGALLDDEDRSLCLLSAHAFLFILDKTMTQEEKENLEILRQITDAIYFVQTKIDKAPQGWKKIRHHNMQIISEVLNVPPRHVKYFSVSTKHKQDADQIDADQIDKENKKEELLKKSKFLQLLKFLEGKLGKTDEEINRQSRDFLKKLKFDAETLLLRVGLINEELSRFENWFKETYEPLKVTLNEESADILRDTEQQMSNVFGSHGYRPITLKVMEQFSDMNTKQLRANLNNIQRTCIDVCIQETKDILDFFIERMDQLCNKIAKQMRHPWKGTVESPASKLSIHFVEELSQSLRVWSELLQSSMYPLMIASGALPSLLAAGGSGAAAATGVAAATGPPGWVAIVVAGVALAVWGIARGFKEREARIMQKEKTTGEIKSILEGIVTQASGDVNRALQKLVRTYTREVTKEFESFKKEADEIISSDKGGSKIQELQIQKSKTETLLKNIGETLGELEVPTQ